MKFNFFVLIACLMIHFIAQAGSAKRSGPTESRQTAGPASERTVASDSTCNCEAKR